MKLLKSYKISDFPLYRPNSTAARTMSREGYLPPTSNAMSGSIVYILLIIATYSFQTNSNIPFTENGCEVD
jgi:hypothetical protein